MKTIEIDKATASLAEYARRVGKSPVILTDAGKPVAALISLKNADWETLALSSDPKFAAIIERSRARHKSEGGVSAAEMRRRLASQRTTPAQ